VAVDRVLSQEEIDNVFKKLRENAGEEDPTRKALVYDFRRPDRIAKDQLRAIHLLHENFARALASSLSAYLRAYVAVNLVSVEQLSFMEFTQCLPSPTCMISLGLAPFDGFAVLEINPTLVFPILEMLLGGSGKIPTKINREITEIEQSIMEGLLRIVLNDLRTAWHAVTTIDFAIESFETEPQLLQILAPNEAVVAISMEVRIGDTAGMMNIGIPSIIIKMLRQKFDQQWSVRKTRATEDERARVLRLIRPAMINLDARLQGPKLGVEALLNLQEGDILAFDYPVDRPLDVTVNGRLKYQGEVVSAGRKRGVDIRGLVVDETQKIAAATVP
jgi:flagellar motor switch protein FliM